MPLAAVMVVSVPALSAGDASPKLATNQAWIENLQAGSKLKVENVEDALGIVFSRLPDEVFVYPTENYYYFTFPADGVIYAGNMRLAAQDRDKGIIHFAAFQQANQSSQAGEMLYKALSADDGVKVEKLGPFSYRVTYREKPVVFKLNDVSAIRPPSHIIAVGEKYLGLVADESGLRFFLFYNQTHKIFSYVLDEATDVLDQFNLTKQNGRILVGQRTGFVVYDHHYLDRRVLIGVHGANTVVNNYYDGPAHNIDKSLLLNGRNLTNIGVFRKYIDAYINNHSAINKDMIIMVRQLEPTAQGIPLEIYAFSSDKRWENYEYIMADIFDHLIAAVPYFDLEIFELPSTSSFTHSDKKINAF